MLLTPFIIIPKTIYETPKIILIFILNEFKNISSFEERFHIGSIPLNIKINFYFTKWISTVVILLYFFSFIVQIFKFITTTKNIKLNRCKVIVNKTTIKSEKTH